MLRGDREGGFGVGAVGTDRQHNEPFLVETGGQPLEIGKLFEAGCAAISPEDDQYGVTSKLLSSEPRVPSRIDELERRSDPAVPGLNPVRVRRAVISSERTKSTTPSSSGTVRVVEKPAPA